MQRLLINCANGALLILILIGVPAATRLELWKLQISWASTPQMLTLWGLGSVALANVAAATVFIKSRKEQELCAKWAFIFAGFWLLDFALFRSWLNFHWLQDALRWFQKHS